MSEVNLLKNYPKSKRKINARAEKKTEAVRKIARKFSREYFDGERIYGYGGYHYHPRFWEKVVSDFQKYYRLTGKSSVLDVGCGKGFMLYDFVRLIPGITVAGIDISDYAIAHALSSVRPYLKVGNAKLLPYPDKSFDLVISINTIHNLPIADCKKALKEISRVAKKHSFITVDAYHTLAEKKRMEDWNLTARTFMSVNEWEKLFSQVGFAGDYYWFIP